MTDIGQCERNVVTAAIEFIKQTHPGDKKWTPTSIQPWAVELQKAVEKLQNAKKAQKLHDRSIAVYNAIRANSKVWNSDDNYVLVDLVKDLGIALKEME